MSHLLPSIMACSLLAAAPASATEPEAPQAAAPQAAAPEAAAPEAAAPEAAAPPAGTPPPTRLFLGHTTVGGERVVPILGTLQTRTDTWVIARITDHGDHVVVEQVPCAMEVKPVAGVRVQLDPDAVPRLPAARFRLDRAEGGVALVAPPWSTGWDTEDLDQDDRPGVTIDVRAPLCGGSLQVASDTTNAATAGWQGEQLAGTLSVRVGQRILGAQGPCLRMVAKDSEEQMSGVFRYAPAPLDATCATVPLSAWPDAAPEGS